MQHDTGRTLIAVVGIVIGVGNRPARRDRRRCVGECGHHEVRLGAVYRDRTGRAVVGGHRIGAVRTVVCRIRGNRNTVHTGRERRRHGQCVGERPGDACRQCADRIGADRGRVVVRHAGPAGGRGACIKHGIGRDRHRHPEAGGVLVARVRVTDRIGCRAGRSRRRAAGDGRDRRIGLGRDGGRVVRSIVARHQVNAVCAVVGNRCRERKLGDARRNRRGDRDGERSGSGPARYHRTERNRTGGTGIVVRRTGPAATAVEGGVRRDRRRDDDSGRRLGAVVGIADRVGDRSARHDRRAAVRGGEREIRRRIEHGAFGVNIVGRGEVGTVGAVIGQGQRDRNRGRTGRSGCHDIDRESSAGGAAHGQRANGDRAGRSRRAAGHADPARRRRQRVERRVRGHNRRQDDAGRAPVAVVGDRIGVVEVSARLNRVRGISHRSDDEIGVSAADGDRARGAVVRNVRIGSVRAVVGCRGRQGDGRHARRQRGRHVDGVGHAAGVARAERADGQGTGRPCVIVRHTRPAGGRSAGIERRIRRDRRRQLEAGRALVACVRIVDRIGSHAAGRRGGSADHTRHGRIRLRGERVRIGRAVVGWRRVDSVSTVVGDRRRVDERGHTRRDGRNRLQGEGPGAAAAGGDGAEAERADRSGVEVGAADPADRRTGAGEGCVCGHGRRQCDVCRALAAGVRIGERVDHASARRDGGGAVGSRQGQIGRRVQNRRFRARIIGRGRIGTVGAVVVQRHGQRDRRRAARNRIRHVDEERPRARSRHGERSGIKGTGGTGGVIRHAYPPGCRRRGHERRIRRDRRMEHDARSALIAVVRIVVRVGNRAARDDRRRSVGESGHDKIRLRPVDRNGTARAVVGGHRVGAVGAVVGRGSGNRNAVHAGRERSRHRQRISERSGSPCPQCTDRVGTDRTWVVVRHAGPAGGRSARIERRVRRDRHLHIETGRTLVAGVRVVDRIARHAGRRRRRAARDAGDRRIGLGRDRSRIGVRIVAAVLVRTVGQIVGHTRHKRDGGYCRRNGSVHLNPEGLGARRQHRQISGAHRADRARAEVRRADPADAGAHRRERRVRRNGRRQHQARRILRATVHIRERVRDIAAGGRRRTAVGNGHHKIGRRIEHGRLVAGVVRGRGIGAVRAVVGGHDRKRQRRHTRRYRIVHVDRENAAPGTGRGDRASHKGTDRSGAVTRHADPSDRRSALIERRIRRDRGSEGNTRSTLVAAVGVAVVVVDRPAGRDCRRGVGQSRQDYIRLRAADGDRTAGAVVRQVRIGAVGAAVGDAGQDGNTVDARRKRRGDRERVGRRTRGAARKRPDVDRADRSRVVVRHAGPAGRRGARIERRAGRDRHAQGNGRRTAVSYVRVADGVAGRARRRRRRSAGHCRDGEVRRAAERRRIGGAVIGRISVGPVGAVVGDGGRDSELRRSGRNGTHRRHREGDRTAAAHRHIAHADRAGGTGVVRRRAGPARASAEGRARRDRRGDDRAGGVLRTCVPVRHRVGDAAPGGDRSAAFGNAQGQVRDRRERSRLAARVIGRVAVGAIGGVVGDGHSKRHIRHTCRDRSRRLDGERAATGTRRRQRADTEGTGRTGIVVRQAGPARRRTGWQESRIERHGGREPCSRRTLVAAVGVVVGIGDRAARVDRHRRVDNRSNREVRECVQRHRTRGAVVAGGEIGAVGRIVAAAHRDADRIDAGGDRRRHGDGKVRHAGRRGRQTADGVGAGRTRVVVRHADPAGTRERRTRRNGRRQGDARGALRSDISIAHREGDGAARSDRAAAGDRRNRDVRCCRDRRRVAAGVITRRRIGAARAVVGDTDRDAEIVDTRGHRARQPQYEGRRRTGGGADARGRQGTDRSGQIVRHTAPGAAAGVGRVGRDGGRQRHARSGLGAVVLVRHRIGDHVAGGDRCATVGNGHKLQVRDGVHRRRVAAGIVGGVRIGAVRAVVGDIRGHRDVFEACRNRRRDCDGEVLRPRGATARDRADAVQAQGARVIVRSADPSRRRARRVEGGVRRHQRGHQDARRTARTRVRIGENIGDAAAGRDRTAAVGYRDRQVRNRRRRDRRRTGGRVVGKIDVRSDRIVVGDRRRQRNRRDAAGERVQQRHLEVGRTVRVVVQRGGHICTDRAGVVVGHAGPARTGKGRTDRNRRGELRVRRVHAAAARTVIAGADRKRGRGSGSDRTHGRHDTGHPQIGRYRGDRRRGSNAACPANRPGHVRRMTVVLHAGGIGDRGIPGDCGAHRRLVGERQRTADGKFRQVHQNGPVAHDITGEHAETGQGRGLGDGAGNQLQVGIQGVRNTDVFRRAG